jgi:hypothetical protein
MPTVTPEVTNLLQFMVVRPPYSAENKSLLKNYIYDKEIGSKRVGNVNRPCFIDADLFSLKSSSAIGKLVYNSVFCLEEHTKSIIPKIINLLKLYSPECIGSSIPTNALPLNLSDLENHAYIADGDNYYILPDKLERLDELMNEPFYYQFVKFNEYVESNKPHSVSNLNDTLQKLFPNRSIYSLVYDEQQYYARFQSIKRLLFDTLYTLYILRRQTIVNLEHIIHGLQTLNLLEALAFDDFLKKLKNQGPKNTSDRIIWKTLQELYPNLKKWKYSEEELPEYFLLNKDSDVTMYLEATPIIHPIFAKLHWYKRPFNYIKPIGIGDLKVVKQWLTRYEAKEISHIDNILLGESKERNHRRLEKTEETFSFSSENQEETTNDTQSTERFELKREVESLVKSDMKIDANTNLQYKGGDVVVTVGGSFAFNRAMSDTDKTANNYSREVVDKAVKRVQSRLTTNRSTTKIFENEETNKHSFSNVGGTKNISGIYCWVDKKYKAQLFNYGKRMMFEFIIPEPAAFFVESRIKSFESSLATPKLPVLRQEPLEIKKSDGSPLNPQDINETTFYHLSKTYDLSEFEFPIQRKRVVFRDDKTNSSDIKNDVGGAGNEKWTFDLYTCSLPLGYDQVTSWSSIGSVCFNGKVDQDKNLILIRLNGGILWDARDPNSTQRLFADLSAYQDNIYIPITSGRLELNIGFHDLKFYNFNLEIEIGRSSDYFKSWQISVYSKIRTIEENKLKSTNDELKANFFSEMAGYKNKISEIKSVIVNDLIQGQSEAFNKRIVLTELKKHCITLITKEFDSYPSDDYNLTESDAVEDKEAEYNFTQFKVDESTDPVTAAFAQDHKLIDYPSINIERSKKKGRFIQFLEQAFEWQQLAYIFYPYFWATQPEWIKLMNRSDTTDPNFSAFLQAGSVKVLLAVTPAYEQAVLHFLATREPWEGGPAPIIGDPLFVPIHEELRKQQDDLHGAKPEGEPWEFTLPTSLVYLKDDSQLPMFDDPIF